MAEVILLRDWCDKYGYKYPSVLSLTYYKPTLSNLIEKRSTQIVIKRKDRRRPSYKNTPMVYILDEVKFTEAYRLITRKETRITNPMGARGKILVNHG